MGSKARGEALLGWVATARQSDERQLIWYFCAVIDDADEGIRDIRTARLWIDGNAVDRYK